MVDLPSIPKRNELLPQVSSSVDAKDYAALGKAWAGAAGAIGDAAVEIGTPMAEEAGRKAVVRDENGALKVEMPPIVGRLGDVARRSAEAAFAVQAQGEVEKNLLELRNKTWLPAEQGGGGGDPGWFQQAANAFINNFAGKHRGGFQGIVQQMGLRVANQHQTALINQRESIDVKNQNDVLKGREAELQSRLATLAFDNGTDSDEFRQTVTELQAIRGQRSADPRFGYSPAEAAQDAERDARTMRGMAIVGQARRDYQASGDLLGAQQRATTALEAAGIPIDERGRMLGQINSHLSGMAAVRNVQKQEYRDRSLELGQRLQRGEKVEDGDVRTLAGEMERVGMFREARQLRIDHAINLGTNDVGTGTAAERVAGLNRAREAGASAPASGFPSSLITTESGGNWRAQNNVPGAGGKIGHFGRLQFGQERLEEAKRAGAMPAEASIQDFLASPEMQKNVERWHFSDIDNYIKANGLDAAIGKTINGVVVTQDGLRAVAHLGGKAGMKRFVETNGQYNPADANGTSLTNYLGRHSGNSAGAAGYSIVTQARVAAAQKAFDASAKAEAATFKESFKLFAGGPSREQAESLMTIAPEISDPKLRDEVLELINENRARLATLVDPKAVDDTIAAMQIAGTQEGLNQREQKFLGYLEKHREAQEKELTSKPYLAGTRMDWDGEAAPRSMRAAALPLQFGDASTLRTQIESRSTASQLLEARFGRPAASLIDKDDAEKLRGSMAGMDAGAVQSIFSTLATARKETIAATLADKDAREALVGLTKTADPAKFGAAMQGLDILMRRDERAFLEHMDADTIEKVLKWRDALGLASDPKQIEAMMNPAARGKESEIAKAQRLKGEKAAREMDDKELNGLFRTFVGRFTGSNPDTFIEPGEGQDRALNLPQNALRADLANAMGEFMASGMSEEKAKAAAVTKIQKMWSVSQVSGQIMKLAPDRIYAKHFGFTPGEMDAEIQAALNAVAGKPMTDEAASVLGRERIKYTLVPDATTQADFRAWQEWENGGKVGPPPAPPRYQVLYEDKRFNPPQLRMVENDQGAPRLFRWDVSKKRAAQQEEFQRNSALNVLSPTEQLRQMREPR
ncbi:MAG: hypothetical protein ACRCTG_15450 [Aestuariivirga sp.]